MTGLATGLATGRACAEPRTVPGATDESVRVWRDLMVLHAQVIGQLEDALESQHGLSVSEFDVLVNLDPTTPMRHGELADRVLLSRTALTRLVDRLVGCGLVERQPDPRDQRAVRIALTDAGRQARRVAARTNARVVRERFGALDDVSLCTLENLVCRLTDQPAARHTDRPAVRHTDQPAARHTDATTAWLSNPTTVHEGDPS